jgi:2-C-methyl-D-erythritol 2,4-cyclodiphosphate synthase
MPRDDDANIRVGIGYDSHRFAAGRPLKLGGVLIPSDVGLLAHSDGDAICHAVTDAIMGAVGMGDVGEMFPNTDPENKGRDSIEMLEVAVRRIAAAGYLVNQVDVTVISETPKLLPHREAIRARLAGALGIESANVSVKGKSNEGMGWIGQKEGLACIAVATLKGNR